MPRIIVRVDITEDARMALSTMAERFGMTQVTMVSRAVEWFCQQDEVTKAAILHEIVTVDATRLVLDTMARKKH